MSGSGVKADAINTTADIQILMSAYGGKADVQRTPRKSPLIAEAVEEVFQPLKTERLIRLVSTCGKNESESVPP